MRRIKEVQYYNDPSYDQANEHLIDHANVLIKELSSYIDRKNLMGIALQEDLLYLHYNGSWEVRNGTNGTILLSPYTELEVVLGYYFAPNGDPEPDSFFFRLTPDIKRTQALQIAIGLLERAIQDMKH